MSNVTQSNSHVSIANDDGVLTVTFNRPDKKNALTATMYSGLIDALNQADADDSIRVVLVRGSAGAFTAGNDLFDFMQNPPNGPGSPVMLLLRTLVDVKTPLVAAVEGPAIGIGTTLLLHCDLVYATPTAKLKMPFVDLGLCPENGSSLLLPQTIGHQRAAELLLLGDVLSGEDAHKMGLVNALYPAETLYDEALAVCKRLAQKPPRAVLLTKRLLRDAQREVLRDVVAKEALAFAEQLSSPEAAEAFAAFFEKRAPDFSKL